MRTTVYTMGEIRWIAPVKWLNNPRAERYKADMVVYPSSGCLQSLYVVYPFTGNCHSMFSLLAHMEPPVRRVSIKQETRRGFRPTCYGGSNERFKRAAINLASSRPGHYQGYLYRTGDSQRTPPALTHRVFFKAEHKIEHHFFLGVRYGEWLMILRYYFMLLTPRVSFNSVPYGVTSKLKATHRATHRDSSFYY